MRVVIFCGPTISSEQVKLVMETKAVVSSTELLCDVRPPAARGDVLAAALTNPNVIALIDGYFDRVPAVWHKELMWAMSKGIHVFGAASMGALRGAELCAFGMKGVGKIFCDFRDGVLRDDDEVAVAHASEELGFRCTSEALVNIRASLDAAQLAGVISIDDQEQLLTLTKALPYWDRSFPSLLRAAQTDLRVRSCDALAQWLKQGRVDQKLSDAREMLEAISAQRGHLITPFSTSFTFAATDAWDAFARQVAARQADHGSAQSSTFEPDWVGEVLLSEHWQATYAGALARAAIKTKLHRHTINARAVEGIVDDFRRERGLMTPASFQEWLRQQGMSEEEVVPFFQAEAELRRARLILADLVEVELVNQLRADGRFGETCARAREKRTRLERRGNVNPTLEDAGIDEETLWQWYFEKRRGTTRPHTLEGYAQLQGVDLDRLRRAVLKEYCYVALIGNLAGQNS